MVWALGVFSEAFTAPTPEGQVCEGAGMGTLTPWVCLHLWTLACAFVLASWPATAPAAPHALPLVLFPLLFLLLKALHKGPTQ